MKNTLTIFASLAAISSCAAMAAEVTIDSTTTLSIVQDSTHPYNAYLQCAGTSTTVNSFVLPPAEEGNTLTISNGKEDNLGLLAAAGFLQYADGNVVSNVLNVEDSVFAQNLYGGYLYSGNGNVEGNVVTVIGSDLKSVRAGQISGAAIGNIFGNSVTISNSTVTSTVLAAYHSGTSGDVTGNSTTISNGSSVTTAYGAYHKGTSGDVTDNCITVSDSTVSNAVYGAYHPGASGDVTGNSTTVSNSTVSKTVMGAYHSGAPGDVTGNSTTVSNGSEVYLVYGAYHLGTSGDVTGNSTTISNSTVSHTVYGAHHSGASGDVTGNSTTISNSSVSYAAYGAYHLGDSGEVANNSLTLRNSTVQEFVYGARFTGESGTVRDNCLTIENCNITNSSSNITNSSSNIYAGQLGYDGAGEGNITGNILSIKDSTVVGNLSAGFHRGSSGNVEDNHVIMENSTQSGANSENKVTAGYIYPAGTSGNITGNTATIINSSVLGVEAAHHQGKSGDVAGNVVVLTDSTANYVHAAFLELVTSEEVSNNRVVLQGESVVSKDAVAVMLDDEEVATIAENVSGNSITLRDSANVGGSLYAYYEGTGAVECADSNYLVIDENWTGTGNETTTFAEDSLNAVINFDTISIGWTEEGRVLTMTELTTNDKNNDALTIRLNAADTVLKVGTLNNATQKDIVVEGTSNVRDALGEGAALRRGLARMASAVQVEDRNSTGEETTYSAVPASAVSVEEGLLYGAVSAEIDEEGNVIDDSVVETGNRVNESLINITASRQLAYRTQGSELTRRLRELRTMPGAKNSCWARATAGREKYALPGSDYRRNGFEAGTDRRFLDGRYVAGLAFGYADTRASFGNGRADEQLYTLGTYAGWQGKRGQYVDFVAKYSRFDTSFDLYSANGALSSGEADTWGGMLSLDYGWRLGAENGGFYAEPFAGLMYGALDGANYTTSRGVSVREDYTDSLVGTVGVTLGYIFAENRATAYARAALHHDWTSEAEVHMHANGNSRSYREDLSGSYGEWAVGGTYRLGENTWVFGEFQAMGGAHVRQPWQLNIGASFGF